MGSKQKTQILDPHEGYETVAKEYRKHHKFLDNWEKGLFIQYLPRELKGFSIIDLWAWDGRATKYFKNKEIKRYAACDISQEMLSWCPNWTEKISTDLEEKLPFEDSSFDIAVCFFTLLHIKNVYWFFEEVYRILKNKWKFIIFHHIERHEFEYNIKNKKIKIKTFPYSYKNIEDIAQQKNFQVFSQGIYEKGDLTWKIFCLEKK